MLNYDASNVDRIVRDAEDVIDVFSKPQLPPDTAIEKTEDTSSIEAQANENLDAEVEVHSHIALERSRAYCFRLISALPEPYSKRDVVIKLLDQEIALQASIMRRSFTDGERVSTVRRILALAVATCAVILAVAAFIYASFHKATVGQMFDFATWMFVYAGGTVLGFYFPKAIEWIKWLRSHPGRTEKP